MEHDLINHIAAVNSLSRGPSIDNDVLVQILDQLSWIRLHLTIFLLIAIFVIAVLVIAGRKVSKQGGGFDFSKRGQELLNEERYEEAVRIGLAHVNAYPGDANAHWVIANAQTRLGRLSEALIHARRVRELQPDWGHSIIGPLLTYLEEQAATDKAKPDLRIVTPNTPPQPDAKLPPI